MKLVTNIKSASKRSSRYKIYLDNEFFGDVDGELVIKYGMRVGKEIDEESLKKLIYENEISKAKNYAFDLLTRRSYSRKEILDKLGRKEFSEDAIKISIETLERLGYIKDEEFARNWVESRKRLKPKGKFALRDELYKKGIDQAIVERVLAEINPSEEREMARRAAEKKVKGYRKLDQKVAKRRLFSFLQRRGFEFEIAREITEDILFL